MLSYTHYKYRVSHRCGFFHAQWGLSAHWRLFHSDHTRRVSLQCGFSDVEQGPSSVQTSFHIQCIYTVFLLQACPHAFPTGPHTEKLFHTQESVKYCHYICWRPSGVGPSLQKSSLQNLCLVHTFGLDSWKTVISWPHCPFNACTGLQRSTSAEPRPPAPGGRSRILEASLSVVRWFVSRRPPIPKQNSQELASVTVNRDAGANSESFPGTESLEIAKAALLKMETRSFLVTGEYAIQ